MLIYRPLQTKGFIKEFTDSLLTMVMKYPDLSSWEISTHTLTRLQIRSPTNSPPGFPPKHSPGTSTVTFIVSLEGSPLLALSGTYHPNSKFQWGACRFRWSSLLLAVLRESWQPGSQDMVMLRSSAWSLQTCCIHDTHDQQWSWAPLHLVVFAVLGAHSVVVHLV